MILKKDIHTNKVNKFPGLQEYNVLDCGMMKKVIPESGTKFSNLTHQNLLSTILLGSFDLYSSTAIVYNYTIILIPSTSVSVSVAEIKILNI